MYRIDHLTPALYSSLWSLRGLPMSPTPPPGRAAALGMSPGGANVRRGEGGHGGETSGEAQKSSDDLSQQLKELGLNASGLDCLRMQKYYPIR